MTCASTHAGLAGPPRALRLALAALLACSASPATAQEGDVYLRCVTGPANMTHPIVARLPMEELLILWVSGDQWREWGSGGWSNDLCAVRQTRCELGDGGFARLAIIPGPGDEIVTLERRIDRGTGAYRKRITTAGSASQVVEWEGTCQAMDGAEFNRRSRPTF